MVIMTDAEKIAEARRLLQAWVDLQGHNRCWYYPDIFNTLAQLLEVTQQKESNIPSLDEFKRGCEQFQRDQYE